MFVDFTQYKLYICGEGTAVEELSLSDRSVDMLVCHFVLIDVGGGLSPL